MNSNEHNHDNHNIIKLSTLDLIKIFINKKIQYLDKKDISRDISLPSPPKNKINHIAVILDGEVQEIMRAQNRLTALLLSNPTFIEFDVENIRPEVGWKYIDGKFYSGE